MPEWKDEKGALVGPRAVFEAAALLLEHLASQGHPTNSEEREMLETAGMMVAFLRNVVAAGANELIQREGNA